MKSPILFSISFALAGAQVPALAREVNLLHFGGPVIITPAYGHETADESVTQSLREQFVLQLAGQSDLATAQHHASDRYAISEEGTSDGSTQGFLFNVPDCDGATYSRTWWLPPATENRRAAYFGAVARVACEHGLPTRLLDAVIAQESGYYSRAISSAGAMGMMQIMPSTARSLGLSRPFDPIANMRAGARYLRQQLDRFGRVDLALAAYNAGPERRSLQRGAIPRIPETIKYVRTITTNWARLAELGQEQSPSVDRARAAMVAVNPSPYRSVELVSYD